ncbi:hypothetical protein [Undibacterium aquatile]|uniref:Uncharacterized protein n=1 Tax=Undibacterium aquatile TaxID=1537398 RepID=A0ABR6XAU0_9BURK|nr:hypothetical protein [Undibacterium aquatile]MBC3809862.1 hypothetical protein [Undibacterium aquatile]
MAIQCRDWHAWLNTMPPKPDDFHVAGDVVVGNPGVEAIFTMREPQGINPTILILDLYLNQKPGNWPQVMTCAPAKFSRVMPPNSTSYQAVEIYSQGQKVGFIDHVSVVS